MTSWPKMEGKMQTPDNLRRDNRSLYNDIEVLTGPLILRWNKATSPCNQEPDSIMT
jgi:hypothetical protein